MRAARRKILLVFVIICMAQLFAHFQLDTYKARKRVVPFLNFATERDDFCNHGSLLKVENLPRKKKNSYYQEY